MSITREVVCKYYKNNRVGQENTSEHPNFVVVKGIYIKNKSLEHIVLAREYAVLGKLGM